MYYHYFDSVVNTYLITHCGLTPPHGEQIGLVVSSFCHFFAPLSFPSVLDLALGYTSGEALYLLFWLVKGHWILEATCS